MYCNKISIFLIFAVNSRQFPLKEATFMLFYVRILKIQWLKYIMNILKTYAINEVDDIRLAIKLFLHTGFINCSSNENTR